MEVWKVLWSGTDDAARFEASSLAAWLIRNITKQEMEAWHQGILNRARARRTHEQKQRPRDLIFLIFVGLRHGLDWSLLP
jgi:hypothetical protein